MARGLSRELSKEKAAKKKEAGKDKSNKEGLSAAARAERDAKAMQEKKAAKEVALSRLLEYSPRALP